MHEVKSKAGGGTGERASNLEELGSISNVSDSDVISQNKIKKM